MSNWAPFIGVWTGVGLILAAVLGVLLGKLLTGSC
jgi:putative Ca2+/H+ antiporter (TMEM165/GDT1 family)